MLHALIVLVVPLALLVPWTGRVWSQPGLLVLGTGRVSPVVDLPHPRPSDLVFGWPGGVGVPAWWLTIGLLVAALGVLVRRDRVLTGLCAWALVAAGLITGIVASHTTATADGVRALACRARRPASSGAGWSWLPHLLPTAPSRGLPRRPSGCASRSLPPSPSSA